jgi:hypothetical protein
LLLIGSVPAVFITVRLLFSSVTVVIEPRLGVAALQRSWQLSLGFGWRILGVMLLIALVLFAVALLAFLVAAPILAGDLSTERLRAFFIVNSIVLAVVGTIANPLVEIAVSLLYLDSRVRKEGFGLDVLERQLDG